MGRTNWLVNGRGLAQKVRNANCPAEHQIKDCGASRECPNCHHLIDNSDVYPEWPGFPAGVKFEPSDLELLDHLAAKCGGGNSEPHMFLDEFIPTLEGDEGICYTHPENLPGARKDGTSVHFFYRTQKAYSTGARKRRKISSDKSVAIENVRWHKTGKTKAVMENGVQKGCKKVMVLYRTPMKGEKPSKTNWVMHQYHLGTDEEEKDGGFVVSKIYYQQQKQNEKNDNNEGSEVPSFDANDMDGLLSDMYGNQVIPTTPMTAIPNPPRAGETPLSDHYVVPSPIEELEVVNVDSSVVQVKDEKYQTCLAGELQVPDDFLLCNETGGSYDVGNNYVPHRDNQMLQDGGKSSSSIADLENIQLDPTPDFSLQDLPFGSQDSLFSWLDRF